MTDSTTRCAIFCRVIDNFGDAAVCWRLAMQLVAEHGWSVTLFIDDIERLFLLASNARDTSVRVKPWHAAETDLADVEVVIEAFACDPPAPYIARMAGAVSLPVWINLEYLSAEPWVSGCHRLASPHNRSRLTKYFFFPGFTEGTGGILRERDYRNRVEHFCPDAFAQSFGITPRRDEMLISYFAYPQADFAQLRRELASLDLRTRILVPGEIGPQEEIGALSVQPIPFLSQREYDELLWFCDINFVRGEDSFVRAQLAGKPFIWQAYPQAEGAHLRKLDAFLDLLLCACNDPLFATVWRKTMTAWNRPAGESLDLASFLGHASAVKLHAQQWRDKLIDQSDMARQLVEFCGKLRAPLE